jgi:hypothetical protein
MLAIAIMRPAVVSGLRQPWLCLRSHKHVRSQADSEKEQSMFFQRVLGIAFLCASPFLMAEDCEYSEWGRDDQIGAANRITPERTIAAAS